MTFGPDVKYVHADMINNVKNIQGGENISYLDVPRFVGIPSFAKAGDFVIEGLTAGVALTNAAYLNLKNAGIYLVHGIEA